MTLDENRKLKREFNISIFSNHKILAENLADWLFTRYSNCCCNTYPKNINTLFAEDNILPRLIIFDIGLSLRKDMDLIEQINVHFPKARMIILIPFRKAIIKDDFLNKRIIGIIPKWQITNMLPAILNNKLDLEASQFNVKNWRIS